jgi:regulator of cell morphogenesis and NO signaling
MHSIIPDDMTVNEVIRRYPDTVKVFNDFSIDGCCGGAVPVRVAALRDGADPDAVLEAILKMVGSAV